MKYTPTFSNLRVALEILLIIILVLMTLSFKSAPGAATTQAPEAPEALNWYVCNAPNHIGLFKNRVHIYCGTTTPIAGAPVLSSSIHWFAIPTAPDSAAASRFMSLMQTSVITSKPVWLQVDPVDTSGSSFGCNASDCRRIYGLEMR